jgi:hypothetical protein
MPPLAPLLAAFFLAPVPPTVIPPRLFIHAGPEKVQLIIDNPRSLPMAIVDPKLGEGLADGLLFIRVLEPHGHLVWRGQEDGWWSPLYLRTQITTAQPPFHEIPPRQNAAFEVDPARLTRGLRGGPTTGQCRFQVKAVVYDGDMWPWKTSGPYIIESNWADIPCARLFPPLAEGAAVP